MDSESLTVDFGNRADMRAKLPRAREILALKEQRLLERQKDTESWRELVEMLERRADLPREIEESEAQKGNESNGVGPASGHDASQHVDLVVDVVNREIRPIRSRDVANTLRQEGIDIDKNSVSNSLYYASVRLSPPRIRKLERRGFYAPLSYVDHPVTDYAHAGSLGFNVPDRPPAPDDEDDVP